MNYKNPKTADAIEILKDYQDRLTQLEELKTHVENKLKQLKIGGVVNFDQWMSACEEYARSKIVQCIKEDQHLPICEDKLSRIPEIYGKGKHCVGEGRWLKNTTPEMLADWIETNIGDPIQKEIQFTLNVVFPPYLRDKASVFDDNKYTISRHVTSLEMAWSGNTMHHKWSFNPEPWIAFLRLCHSVGANIPFEDSHPPIPPILDKNFSCEKSELYRWHAVEKNAGVSRIRILKDGIWRFELFDQPYLQIRQLGDINFAKPNTYT